MAADDPHRVQEGEGVGVDAGLAAGVGHQPAQRQMHEHEPIQLLQGEIGEAAAQQQPLAGQRHLELGEGALALPPLVVERCQLRRGRRVRLEQRGDQTVQRLGIGHSVQTVVDHADDEPAIIMPAMLGRGVEAAQIGAVGQALSAGQDLVGAHPPQEIGARG